MIALLAALTGLGQGAAVASGSAPFAINGDISVDENSSTNFSFSALDGEGDVLTLKLVTQPAHGDLTTCSRAFCVYTPDPGYQGPDSFTWRVNDGTSDSNLATTAITVNPDPNGPAISSAGPLGTIRISPTLNCIVLRTGETVGAFFENACGTFAAVDGVLYAPATVPGGSSRCT